MLGKLGKQQHQRKQNRMPYSFGYAPLIVGIAVIGLVAWWWATEEPSPTFLSAPGEFWEVMALSVGFVISGVIGLVFVWRVNRHDRDEEAQ